MYHVYVNKHSQNKVFVMLQSLLHIPDKQMEASSGHVLRGDHPYCNRVMRVAQKIVSNNQDLDFMRDQKWTVIVVDSTEQNAFVLPVSGSPETCQLMLIQTPVHHWTG